MKKIAFAIMGILMALLLFSPSMVKSNPPRHCEGLDIYFYEDPDSCFTALMAGEIDFMAWALTFPQYLLAAASPDIQLAGYAENGIYEFDLNNNYTIADFPGVRSMMNDVEFRRAIAQMVDKNWIISFVIDGFAERIDCPICAPQKGYGNETCCFEETYPYPYSIAAANARLDAAGFDDVDQDGIRNYPADWPGRPGRPNLDPVKICIRSDHGHRLTAGNALVTTMTTLCHIPTNPILGSSDVLKPIVMNARNYHIYTGGWGLGRWPLYLHGLFHSENWFPDGENYITGMNASNLPNYPDLDDDLYHVKYAETDAEFRAAVKRASGKIVCDYCVNVALWSYVSYWAYRKPLVGVVNMKGYGIENTYTFLNAKKCNDPDTPQDESQEPIRMGLIHAPKALNILYSSWVYDYSVLDRVFPALMSVNPYNLAKDQPWIAQDWEVSTWYDPQDDEEKTKVTYWIRKDVWWHEPDTGEVVQQFTAHDVEFSIWYNYKFSDSWQHDGFKDIHHTKIIDDFCIEVYFDSKSIWFVYYPTYPLLKKHALIPLLCEEEYCEFVVTEPRNPSDKDILCPPCGSIIQIIDVTKMPEDIPLIEGVDFEILGTGSPEWCHNEIHWLRPLDPGETIIFHYYTTSADPHGYYLADLDWSLTWYSVGPYIPIDIQPGVGGWAIFDCNPCHFLGAPPEGEIDWDWTWSGTTHPRSGYYQVNIYDAVMLLKAYCSRGDGVPPTNWEPGADMDCFDLCHVGLYDAVMLLTNYGAKFGIPPDP